MYSSDPRSYNASSKKISNLQYTLAKFPFPLSLWNIRENFTLKSRKYPFKKRAEHAHGTMHGIKDTKWRIVWPAISHKGGGIAASGRSVSMNTGDPRAEAFRRLRPAEKSSRFRSWPWLAQSWPGRAVLRDPSRPSQVTGSLRNPINSPHLTTRSTWRRKGGGTA